VLITVVTADAPAHAVTAFAAAGSWRPAFRAVALLVSSLRRRVKSMAQSVYLGVPDNPDNDATRAICDAVVMLQDGSARSDRTMQRLTRWILWLTVAIVVLTVAIAAMTALLLIKESEGRAPTSQTGAACVPSGESRPA
jgi:ABC-type sugar transport system permease subunit